MTNNQVPARNAVAIPERPSTSNVPICENWLAKRAGKTRQGTFEFPLFTDAFLPGEVRDADSPYLFLNALPVRQAAGRVQPGVILRVDIHMESRRPDFPIK